METRLPLALCMSCAKPIYEDLYKCPKCNGNLHGGSPSEGCGSWFGDDIPVRHCQMCALELQGNLHSVF